MWTYLSFLWGFDISYQIITVFTSPLWIPCLSHTGFLTHAGSPSWTNVSSSESLLLPFPCMHCFISLTGFWYLKLDYCSSLTLPFYVDPYHTQVQPIHPGPNILLREERKNKGSGMVNFMCPLGDSTVPSYSIKHKSRSFMNTFVKFIISLLEIKEVILHSMGGPYSISWKTVSAELRLPWK